MGTTWRLGCVVRRGAPPLAPIVEAALAGVIASMSQWEPASALSRFNAAPVGSWHALPADLSYVLDTGLRIGRTTGGAFDVASGALADLWGFGPPGPRMSLPSEAEVATARVRSGGHAIERAGTRTRRTAEVALDLSGIAKGYAVDALAAALRAHGFSDFLAEIGGEFVGVGIKPDGTPWWVDLENPPGIALPPLRVAAHGLAIATSGDYRRFIAHEGKRLGHTLDPRNGRPVTNGVVSVSVLASDCMSADAWATALTVLGPAEGIALAAREGLAARIVTANGHEILSPALAAMLGSRG